MDFMRGCLVASLIKRLKSSGAQLLPFNAIQTANTSPKKLAPAEPLQLATLERYQQIYALFADAIGNLCLIHGRTINYLKAKIFKA